MLLDKFGFRDKPELVFCVSESHIRMVQLWGRRYVYQKKKVRWARGFPQNCGLLGASDTVLIFTGARWDDILKPGSAPNAKVALPYTKHRQWNLLETVFFTSNKFLLLILLFCLQNHIDGPSAGRSLLWLQKAMSSWLPWGTRWRSWLRHCATSRKVAGSIPDGVTGIFDWHNPSGRIMALGLIHLLTEMSTRNNSWRVKAYRS
jgi:hypothetical protein